MKDLRGKVAVVTGSGSGIGRGMIHAFADAGVNVVVADIEEGPAESVAREAATLGVRSLAVPTDVADRGSVEALAEKAYAEFGAVQILCNNAGVGAFGPLDQASDSDWRWVLSVNLEGVVHGLQAFLPRMKADEGEKHIVNTASMAGLVAFPGLGVYTASKYAVVGISETLRQDVASYGIGVSVLCPGLVATNIYNSQRNRPAALGGPGPLPPMAGERLRQEGMDPLEVGRLVRRAVEENELYILTHPQGKPAVEARFRGIADAFDRAATGGRGAEQLDRAHQRGARGAEQPDGAPTE